MDGSRLRMAVSATWPELTRDLTRLAEAASDPKLPQDPPWTVYLPRSFPEAEARIGPLDPRVVLRPLPTEPEAIQRHGLLFLPGPYVVPGGRFNELYGWDSWFIQRGLVRSGEHALARSQYEQIRFEIEHYGRVLNANRSYYLTRTQPPLFTRMLRDALGPDPDPEALAAGLEAAERVHSLWTCPPRLDPATGLSRYRDDGQGPAPEVLASERDAAGRTHYERIVQHLEDLAARGHDVRRFLGEHGLTSLAYLGDRSMREGGYDPSHRFGPLSLDIVRHAPVCLNTMLWVTERDLAWGYRQLGEPALAARYERWAGARATRLLGACFDENEGLFFDLDLDAGTRSGYPFLSTFIPLWAGLATEHQAARVRERLPLFERQGGLMASPYVTGCQWDAPFGWAPLHLFAVAGLARYGYVADARRVAEAFVTCIAEDFEVTGVFREKYDAERASGRTDGIEFGYETNEIGFGWTNGVLLELLDFLETGIIELPTY